jgi:hypothetical protein
MTVTAQGLANHPKDTQLLAEFNALQQVGVNPALKAACVATEDLPVGPKLKPLPRLQQAHPLTHPAAHFSIESDSFWISSFISSQAPGGLASLVTTSRCELSNTRIWNPRRLHERFGHGRYLKGHLSGFELLGAPAWFCQFGGVQPPLDYEAGYRVQKQ